MKNIIIILLLCSACVSQKRAQARIDKYVDMYPALATAGDSAEVEVAVPANSLDETFYFGPQETAVFDSELPVVKRSKKTGTEILLLKKNNTIEVDVKADKPEQKVKVKVPTKIVKANAPKKTFLQKVGAGLKYTAIAIGILLLILILIIILR